MSKVKLISKSVVCDPDLLSSLKDSGSEAIMMYCARVSNPANQTSDNTGLIKYCAKAGHWSIFEMSNFVFEIVTSRAITAQILRHRSFSFQEFSQRYSEATSFETYPARRQDFKNRQNSIADMSTEDLEWFEKAQADIQDAAAYLYEQALARGIAKEQSRMLLPMSTTSKIYMNGSLRSYIHYINVRTDPSTQLEHREIAEAIKVALAKEVPNVAQALGWTNEKTAQTS